MNTFFRVLLIPTLEICLRLVDHSYVSGSCMVIHFIIKLCQASCEVICAKVKST
jgi:hypothetical protein